MALVNRAEALGKQVALVNREALAEGLSKIMVLVNTEALLGARCTCTLLGYVHYYEMYTTVTLQLLRVQCTVHVHTVHALVKSIQDLYMYM